MGRKLIPDSLQTINKKLQVIWIKYPGTPTFSRLVQLLLLFLFLYSCKATRYVPEGDYLLDKVTIDVSDNQIKTREMRRYLKQKPNLKILGMVRFHLGLYNMSGRKEKGLNRWLRKIGEPPVLYDDYASEKSNEELKRYLFNKGFADAQVEDTVVLNYKRKRAEVIYMVNAGVPYRLRNHTIKVADDEIKYIIQNDESNSLMKQNMLYDLDVLNAERNRITRKLKENGYYHFSRNDIAFVVDTTIGNKMVDDTLVINNPVQYTEGGNAIEDRHKKYQVKDIYYITDFNPQLALQNQQQYLQDRDTAIVNGRYFLYREKLKIKPDVLLNNTLIEPFQYYDYRDVTKTHNLLLSMPIIQFDNIRFIENNDAAAPSLDCYIQLTQGKSQSFSLDVEGTNSSGNIGAALKLNYEHRNLFRGAEIFNAQATLGSETQQSISDQTNFNSQQLGLNTTLIYPKFIFPGFSQRLQKRLKARTSFIAAYNYQQRPDYTRYISQLGMRYNWKGESLWSKTVSLIDFNYVGIPYMSDAWWDRIKNTFEKYSYEPHVISSTGYTVSYTDQELGKYRNSKYLRLNIEAAGNTLYMINKAFNAVPDSTGAYNLFGVPVSQYVKFDADGVFNHYINEKNRVAYRLAGGVAYPYGNRKVLPFEKRYFAGGANSLRAWRVRSLGPGSYTDSLNINQLGDIRLEANVEYRFTLINILEGALFIDAGNIWTIYDYESQPGGLFKLSTFYKDIAIGYGAGLRLDLSFFVFRFDVGVKFRDPQRSMGNRWIFNPTGRDTAFNFAIGYPF